jgi:small subunit ribosomal protein S17
MFASRRLLSGSQSLLQRAALHPACVASSTACLRAFSTAPSSSSSVQEFDLPFRTDFSNMSNDELANPNSIPGWNLVHNPPRTFPRGALVGTVVSTKMEKTVNVAVDRYRIIPKIRKRMKYTRKFMAHDESEVASLGDLVMITPCHRISKHKHFMLREIVRPKGQL